jgi:hypothetical protein
MGNIKMPKWGDNIKIDHKVIGYGLVLAPQDCFQ